MEYFAKTVGHEKLGYGVDRNMTRDAWQKMCLTYLLSGPEVFNSWQQQLIAEEANSAGDNPYDWTVVSRDSESETSEAFGWADYQSRFVVDISGHTFEDLRMFEDYGFQTGALFVGNTFKQGLFLKGYFHRSVGFVGNHIIGSCSVQAGFSKYSLFDYNHFAGLTSFSGTTFSSVQFANNTFEGQAFFQGVSFGSVNFDGSTFHASADFSGGEHSNQPGSQSFGRVSFRGAQFDGEVDFSNRKFLHSTSFGKGVRRSTEFKRAPIFHNSELHQNTSFDGAKFALPNKADVGAAKAYGTLRHAMSKHQATRDEQLFLILELDAEKNSAKRGVANLYTLYKVLAGYGFSISRPAIFLIFIPFVISLVCLSFFSSFLNCDLLFSSACKFNPDTFASLTEFSFLQSLPPLGLDKIGGKVIGDIFADQAMYIFPLIIVQKILSLVGWFFIALALRHLFKIK